VVNFQKWDSWTCSIQFDFPSYFSLYTAAYDIFPEHIYKYIAIPPGSESGTTTTGHHGEWPGKDSLSAEIAVSQPDNPDPFTHTQLTTGDGGKYVWVGTNMWKYRAGSYVAGVGGGITLDAYQGFWMHITQGEMTFRYTWNSATPPASGQYNITLSDLVMLAQAYGTNGTCWPVPFQLGGPGVWESGTDVAPPHGVGLSDLVTLAQAYQRSWGPNPGGPITFYTNLKGPPSYDVNVTAKIWNGSDLTGVPISIDNVPSNSSTPSAFVGQVGGHFWSVPMTFEGHTFLCWSATHGSGIGIHANYN
jgi:hypothetical protein